MKNKELQVVELLENYSLDALIITETWLTCSEIDRQWLHTTPLNRNLYTFIIKTDPKAEEVGWRLSLRIATTQR